MNDAANSFSEFFYNLIPGILFVLVLKLIFFPRFNLPKEQNLTIVLIIILGLFVGFLLQGVNKLFKDKILDRQKVYENIAEKDKTFLKVRNILERRRLIDKNIKKDQYQDFFYKIDNYLRGKSQAALIDHFAGKAAFWSNTFWASVFIMGIIFIIIFFVYPLRVPEPILLLAFIISLCVAGLSFTMSKRHWHSQYSTALKAFLMVYEFDLKTKPNSSRS